MNILSLFDGMSCGQIALNRAGITVDNYYASEIDKHAIKVTMHNYPSTIQLGSVVDVTADKLPNIDLLIGGSPCQSFSFAGLQKGMSTKCGEEVVTLERYLELKNEGFQFEGQSYLFWEYVRLLTETKPKYFLLENVVMHKKWEAVITKTLGVDPILINSSLLSAQNRKRLYWTNIPNVTQPEDKGIVWGDVKESGVNGESYYYTEAALHWLAENSRLKNKVLTVHKDSDKMQMIEASHSKKYSNQRFFGIVDIPTDTQAVAAMRGRYIVDGKRMDGKMKTAGNTTQFIEFRYDGKTNCLTTVGKDNVVVPFTKPDRIPVDEFFFRYITPTECEKLQTVPVGYTSVISDTQRYRCLGNGWTVDVIAHILGNIKQS
jgi:DNA (cytosine-5)-methyltransferase 1